MISGWIKIYLCTFRPWSFGLVIRVAISFISVLAFSLRFNHTGCPLYVFRPKELMFFPSLVGGKDFLD